MNGILSGKIALVTGGTRGIGRAVATRLAREGAVVALTGRSAETASQAAAEIAAETGAEIEGRACDSGDAKACQAVVDDLAARRGGLDILVNNAGQTRDKLIMRMTDEDWLSLFDANLHGAFYLCRAAAKLMLKRRAGRIVNISSVVGIAGNPGQTNYAATKAGLIGFTKSLARELASRGITVNSVAPGYIETAMTDAIDEKYRSQVKDHIPLGRFGSPEDVAEATLFLVSPAASYITGVVLQVDGGMAM